MGISKKKSIYYLSFSLIALEFMNMLFRALIKGGRWDLNEQIAFAYRLSEGMPKYANGITDLFPPSSPYFPGVGLLSYIYQIIGIQDIYINNQVMIVTAVLLGIIYFFILRRLTFVLFPSLSTTYVTVLLTIFYAFYFDFYLYYMDEFKPDTALLAIGTGTFMWIEASKNIDIKKIISASVLLFISVFLKQTFFLIFLLLFLPFLLKKEITIKRKIYTFLYFTIVSLAALYIIFSFDNIYYFTIEIMGRHPVFTTTNIKRFIIDLIDSVKYNHLFIAGLICYFYNKSNLNLYTNLNNIKSRYFLFSLAWLVFSLVSTIKSGGNRGNIEVGLIVFAPFAINGIFIASNGIIDYINSFDIKYYLQYSIITILLIGIFSNYNLLGNYKHYKYVISRDHSIILFLHENFNKGKALVDGDTFINAKKAGLDILTETETIGHFVSLNYDFSNLNNAFSNQKYDIIYLSTFPTYLGESIIDHFKHNYKELRSNKVPEILKGKIYIPKK